MATLAPVHAASFDSMGSRKRSKLITSCFSFITIQYSCYPFGSALLRDLILYLYFAGAPLPYLIRPRKRQPVYDTYALYNDYIAYSSLEGTTYLLTAHLL